MTEWTLIGHVADIPRLGSRLVETAQGLIAVFRDGQDQIFALHNRCPHRGGPLSEGIVYGGRVSCPLHNWAIDLKTGQAVAPDNGCTPSVPVHVKDGAIALCLDAPQAPACGC